MTQASTLLTDVRNYLDITWTDTNTDNKLLKIIERGMRYLDRTAGVELDYSIEDKPKELLLDYCRYVRSNALEEFQTNYLHELLTLQIKYETATYEEKAQLYSLEFTGMALTPTFSASVKEYTTSTTDTTNVINAVSEDMGASISIMLNSTTEVTNDSEIEWQIGRNIVIVTSQKDELIVTYKITVIKS